MQYHKILHNYEEGDPNFSKINAKFNLLFILKQTAPHFNLIFKNNVQSSDSIDIH